MKKSLSVVLLAAMLVTLFSGCSLFGDSIVGKWESEVDITQFMLDGIKEGLGEDAEELSELLNIKDLKVKMFATFNDDGSYEIGASKESVEALMSSAVDQILAGMKNVLMKEAETVGATEEAVNAILEQASIQLKAEVSEQAITDIVDAFATKGFYKLSDGKLYTAETVEALESAGYETYELKDDTLTINKGEGLDETYSEVVSDFYPITYKKVAE